MAPLSKLYLQLDDVELPDVIPYSQVSAWELRFLYLLGRHRLTGEGKVIELGSGGGGSTYALALGLQENPDFDKKTNKLHAYDFFRVGKGTFASEKFFSAGAAPEDTNSFLDDFKDKLKPFINFIELHPGDIWQTSDPEDHSPIEFLHVDIAKTARVFRCVAERFLPRLEPGSVLLHQDFASPRLPWLHYSTGLLLPYIEIAGPPIRSTLAFEVIKPIPQDVLRAIAEDAFDTDEKLKLMSAVQDVVDRDYTDGIPFKAVIELAKAYVAHYEGDHPRAWKIAKPLTSNEYLSRTRKDHFAQLEKALNAAEPSGGSSGLARLVKKVTRRA
ncbi:class I SAM-dependent methyltransferase [Streptomyces sp. NBC_00873]|uniref:class I SAM-dependent methyltransferase n=1 Tax=unclassified Streptomyces TaxID=2593676 RepID=UPI003868BF2D|nr:class I SAM-dependent methyltransferase [Streptomyces sp. NBC_00873]WTA47827.1 class I SAM-dependent methyltransferase [Streptomyces sp. NBC_00842]